MSVLRAAQRNKLPASKFALPKERKFPISSASHARNALARASQSGNPSIIAKVKRKVHALFPSIKQRPE